jgi:hypothetical protein
MRARSSSLGRTRKRSIRSSTSAADTSESSGGGSDGSGATCGSMSMGSWSGPAGGRDRSPRRIVRPVAEKPDELLPSSCSVGRGRCLAHGPVPWSSRCRSQSATRARPRVRWPPQMLKGRRRSSAAASCVGAGRRCRCVGTALNPRGSSSTTSGHPIRLDPAQTRRPALLPLAQGSRGRSTVAAQRNGRAGLVRRSA